VSKPEAPWFYLQLYLAPPAMPAAAAPDAEADALLREALLPALAAAQASGRCRRWFFIRYGEGGYHLRLRALADDAEAMDAELERAVDGWLALHPGRLGGASSVSALRARGQWRRCDYEPEYDKYGGPAGVDAAERHFQACSELTLAVLRLDAQGVRKDQVALWLFGQAIAASGLAVSEQQALCAGHAQFWQTGFADAGFSGAEPAAEILGRFYAARRDAIAQFLPAGDDDFTTVFATRRPAVELELGRVRALYGATLARFIALERDGALRSPFLDHAAALRMNPAELPTIAAAPLSGLLALPNLVHMMNNRIGISVSREAQLAWYVAARLAERHGAAAPLSLVLEPAALAPRAGIAA